MTSRIEWVLVSDAAGARLGAVGFLGDAASVLALFDADAGVEDVIAAARTRPEAYLRDPGIAQLLGRGGSEFANALPLDAEWSEYFRPGVEMATRGADRVVHGASVKRIVARRGAEVALREALAA